MKLRFGKTGQVEPLPSGRLVTSFDVPPGQSSPRGADPAVSPAPRVPAARAEPPAPADNLDAIASLVIERLSPPLLFHELHAFGRLGDPEVGKAPAAAVASEAG